MSKAEKRAKETYPSRDAEHVYDEERVIEAREYFVEGYHQAEKDLELTWEDIRELYIIFAEVDTEIELCKTDITAETLGYYKEILKRFGERKEK